MITTSFELVVNHWRGWLWNHKRHDKSKIEGLRDVHKGSTIFCVGAGPSLKNDDLSLLNNQILILTNSAHGIVNELRPASAYWLVRDPKVTVNLQDVSRERFTASIRSYNKIKSGGMGYVFKPPLSTAVKNEDIYIKPPFTMQRLHGIIPYPVSYRPRKHIGRAVFSHDLVRSLTSNAGSVIFSAIELAVFLGAARIVLLGVDMDYGQAQGAHFDGIDHGPIAKKAFYYEETARPAFIECKTWLEKLDVRAYNASSYSKEDIFERITLYNAIVI